MMLGFIVSAIVTGQILALTRRYKLQALLMFAGGAAGMLLLSRMDATATEGLVIRNVVITGLAIGGVMSLFMVVVQNAFPQDQLGQVTASLQFFRSLGGTVGAAVFGSVVTNRFQSGLTERIPAPLKEALPAERLEALQNPQVLLAPEATLALKQSFAAFGEQGQTLFEQLIHVMRVSLGQAITELFLVGVATLLLGFVLTIFIREIPLRKRDRTPLAEQQSSGAEAPEDAAALADEAAPVEKAQAA